MVVLMGEVDMDIVVEGQVLLGAIRGARLVVRLVVMGVVVVAVAGMEVVKCVIDAI